MIATQGYPAIAEDVVQETFLRAIKEADKLREETSMFPWLVKIALRAGIDYRRKIRREMLTDTIVETADVGWTSAADLDEILRGLSPSETTVRQVSSAVNDARYDGPECLAPPVASNQGALF